MDAPNPLLADIIYVAWREDTQGLDRLLARLTPAENVRLARLLRTMAAGVIRHKHDQQAPLLTGQVVTDSGELETGRTGLPVSDEEWAVMTPAQRFAWLVLEDDG